MKGTHSRNSQPVSDLHSFVKFFSNSASTRVSKNNTNMTFLVLERDNTGLEHAEPCLHREDDKAGCKDPRRVVPVPHRPWDHLSHKYIDPSRFLANIGIWNCIPMLHLVSGAGVIPRQVLEDAVYAQVAVQP